MLYNYKLILIPTENSVVGGVCVCLSMWLFYINGIRLQVLFFNLLFSLNHTAWRSFHMEVFSMNIFSFSRLPKSCLKGPYNLHFQQST